MENTTIMVFHWVPLLVNFVKIKTEEFNRKGRNPPAGGRRGRKKMYVI